MTLYQVANEDETDEDVETLLDGVESRLVESGMAEDAIDVRLGRNKRPLDAIVAEADEFDAVVMGESDPSLFTFVFGMHAKQVAERFLGPVLVVQRERPNEDKQTDSSA